MKKCCGLFLTLCINFSCYFLPAITFYWTVIIIYVLSIIQALMFLHQNNQRLLVHDEHWLVSHWPPALTFQICKLLITTFVDLQVVTGRSRNWADCPQAVSWWPMLIYTCHTVLWPWEVALKTAWSEHGRGAAWAWHDMCKLTFKCQNPGTSHSLSLAVCFPFGHYFPYTWLCTLCLLRQ